MSRPLVYLAGPMTGLTALEANDWRLRAIEWLGKQGIDCASPMRGKLHLKAKEVIAPHYDTPLSNPLAIITRDHYDVCRADALLVNLAGDLPVSIGTVAEMAWAFHLHTPCVTIIDKDSVYAKHPFIAMFARFRADDLKLGMELVRDIIGRNVR